VFLGAVGEKAEVANTHEAIGQNMEEESADELLGIERHRFQPVFVSLRAKSELDRVHVTIVRQSQAAIRAADDRRSQKSSKRPLSLQQRRAIIASAPATVQCIPDRLQRVPTASLQPASTTPVETHRP